jgi:glycosyltransferase involved in cell wall biosynthesis
MALGNLLLRFRQWSAHGLVTAYYRDLVRPRILHTAPVRDTIDPICELHVLTCGNDWLNLMWSLKTFYHFSKRRYRLCIHDDGTVPDEGLAHLRRHFPDGRLILRSEADEKAERELRGYPQSLRFRRMNPLAPKVLDFSLYLQGERMLLFDSDLLFFDDPKDLLRRIEDPSYGLNAVNADLASAYTVEPSAVKSTIGLQLVERFNSGLGLIHKASMRWDWIEEFLRLPGILEGHFWRIEQTLYALCSSRHGVELLPDAYSVSLGPGLGTRPMRHYVGAIRHLMYREGLARLVRMGFLNAWNEHALKTPSPAGQQDEVPARCLRVVHLPVYSENAYQPLLMKSLARCGLEVIDGGGGGDFFRTALFRWKANIYHFHWLHPYLLRAGRMSSLLRAARFLLEVVLIRLSGARVVWTVHNLVNHDRRLPAIERFCSTIFARLTHGIIVHSNAAELDARRTYQLPEHKRLAVIPQGSYVDHYPNRLEREYCRATLALPADGFVFLFLGRIERYKGILDLIRCFRELDGRATLLIAGRTPDCNLYHQLHEEAKGVPGIRLHHGFIDDDQLQLYFNAADAFVFPVRDILNSSSIALAMSFGLACVAPAFPGIQAMLGHEGGILYDPNDPRGLSTALETAMSRRSELREIGRKNLLRARENTWTSVARRTAAFYRSVLGGNQRAEGSDEVGEEDGRVVAD